MELGIGRKKGTLHKEKQLIFSKISANGNYTMANVLEMVSFWQTNYAKIRERPRLVNKSVSDGVWSPAGKSEMLYTHSQNHSSRTLFCIGTEVKLLRGYGFNVNIILGDTVLECWCVIQLADIYISPRSAVQLAPRVQWVQTWSVLQCLRVTKRILTPSKEAPKHV